MTSTIDAGHKVVRPYGDTTGDGRVQVSFTLPVPYSTEEEQALAEGAAAQLATKMGPRPTTAATWSMARTCWPCSATWPPRRAS